MNIGNHGVSVLVAVLSSLAVVACGDGSTAQTGAPLNEGGAGGGGSEGGEGGELERAECHTDARCNDDDPCTEDLCVDYQCQHEAVDVDDGNDATADWCLPGAGPVHLGLALPPYDIE